MTSIQDFRRRVLDQEAGLRIALREAYGVVDFEVLQGPSWNLNLRAAKSDGAALFLKIINEETGSGRRSLETWHKVLDYQERLAASGCRLILAPVRNYAHEIVTEWESWMMVAYPWIDHEVSLQLLERGPQPSAVVEDGARLLAQLHDAMDAVSGTILEDEPMPLCQTPALWAERLCELRDAVMGHLVSRGEAEPDSLHRLADIYSAAQTLAQSDLPLFRPQPGGTGMVHGDFRPENILTTAASGPVVIDLDLLHQAPRIADVALGALNFSGKRFLVGPRQWDRVSLFIDTYAANRPLTQSDVSCALEFVVLRSALASFKGSQLAERIAIQQSLRARAQE